MSMWLAVRREPIVRSCLESPRLAWLTRLYSVPSPSRTRPKLVLKDGDVSSSLRRYEPSRTCSR